jgi:endonuclease/exonuclease/phosphatase (EEP) superfamily protein YafD
MYRKLLPWHIEEAGWAVAVKTPEKPCMLKGRFTLLNWNVHKNNHALAWLEDFSKLLRHYRPELILFQEYQTMNRKSVLDKHLEYGYGFFPNIVWKHNLYGLITASRAQIVDLDYYMTDAVEPIIKTPKVTLETTYKIDTERKLRVVNVHMINFVKIGKFLMQIGQIEKALAKDDAALILAGDFNTWNRKRMHILQKLCERYGLRDVRFLHQKHQKAPFPYPLDHIFYKDLTLERAEVLSEIETSDHKPLLVTFSTK